jgi:hypothetical protein
MEKREVALKLGGAGLCLLALGGKLVTKEDVNGGPPIVVSGAGWKATMDFLIRAAPNQKDLVLSELIVLLPSIICLDDFMKKLPNYEATPEEFEQLVTMGHVV